jgi:protein SCO1/2
LGADGEKLQIVFVSVDPEIDTPASVGAYADLFKASMIGLTGTPDQIAEIARTYRVMYMKVPQPSGGYNVDHSTSVFLMDSAGRFSGVLTPLDSEEEALGKLRLLVAP